MKTPHALRIDPDCAPSAVLRGQRHLVVRVEGDDRVVERVNAALAQAGVVGQVLFDGEMPDPSQLETLKLSDDQLSPENRKAFAESLGRGEEQLVRWTQDGTLVEGAELMRAWGLSRQAVDAARRRQELFSLRVKGRHWYPAEFLRFTRQPLAEIVHALGAASAGHNTLFFLRGHGALGGLTPAQAVQAGRLADVLRIAGAWADD